MPTKSRHKKNTEVLTRRIQFNEVSFRVDADLHYERPPRYAGSGAVELRGKLDAPVRDCSDVVVVVYSADAATVGKEPVPWIGLADVSRGAVRPIVFLPHRDFDRIWTLALSGRLKHGRLMMTAPRSSHAYTVNLSVSTDPEK